jgi:hypothetical protein
MIIKKMKKEFEVPDEGSYLAVVADVEHLPAQTTPWGVQKQVRVKWLLQQLGKDGKELSVIATFNESLDDRSKLFAAITDITGIAPGEQYDTENLIGLNCRLTIKPKKKLDGGLFPKVVAILRPAKGDPVLLIPAWFKRAGNNNMPPSAAATTAPPKSPAPNKAATSKPAGTILEAECHKSGETVAEPPEGGDWDASDYATGFPNSDTGNDEHVA